MSTYPSPAVKRAPFRFDVVGSFLRPAALRQARADFEAGRIARDELTRIENEAIRDLVAKQKAAGLEVITDGEFRRSSWHLDFMWGFEGIGHSKTETGLPFHGETAMLDDTYLIGKLSAPKEPHPFIGHFEFVHALEDPDHAAKLTIPAPAQFIEQLVMPFALENTRKHYGTTEELADDLVALYRGFIADAYAAGCRNLQFDDCSWGLLVDPRAPQFFGTDEAGLADIMELFLSVNNRALEGRPADLTVNTHVCRGNFHSTYASSGPYDRVAEFLFARENVDAFYLEFDDARSGGFEPLRAIAPGKKAVLGLITSKSPQLEEKEAVKARIYEAAQILPLDRLCLSPQCGFASCEVGNKLTEDEQWAKLALVREIAQEVWG